MGDVFLFAGHRHYPEGGALDFRMRGTVDECKAFFLEHAENIAGENYIDNWGQLVNPETMQVIEKGELENMPGDITKPGIPVWEKIGSQ